MELNYSLEEIDGIAASFITQIAGFNTIAFFGNLGAGKTTFISTLCKKLGVVQNVSSPTFSIINEYKTPKGEFIYHMDLYRLRDEHEAREAGVEEYLSSGNLCLIEWPERAELLFEENAVKVYLEVISDKRRKMNLIMPVKNE